MYIDGTRSMNYNMSTIPNKPTSLSHQECLTALSRIQEACFLDLQIINDSPVYVWTNDRPARSSLEVASAVSNILLEMGLNPKDW